MYGLIYDDELYAVDDGYAELSGRLLVYDDVMLLGNREPDNERRCTTGCTVRERDRNDMILTIINYTVRFFSL